MTKIKQLLETLSVVSHCRINPINEKESILIWGVKTNHDNCNYNSKKIEWNKNETTKIIIHEK